MRAAVSPPTIDFTRHPGWWTAFTRILVSGGLLVAGLASSGCTAEIGDSCTTNIECSPSGDRICDTAQAGGYCTVQGCSASGCPEEAVCVGFFAVSLLSQPCDPHTEDAVDPAITPTNACRGDERCLSSGFCSIAVQENRFCMRTCEDDSDCREEYECRLAGTKGAEPVLDPQNPTLREFRFCAQRPVLR